MASTNQRARYCGPVTHEGGIAKRINKKEQLRRAVFATMLWERQFYEGGVSISDRIVALTRDVPQAAIEIMKEAKHVHRLRHAPLLIAVTLAEMNAISVGDLAAVICRADELAEVLALYWRDGKKPIPGKLKKALANAFTRFDEYQLAKWNRKKEVKLRDVMRLVHPKPENQAQEKMWGRLVRDELAPPRTWEQRLSAGEDKRTVFSELITDNKIGGLAFVRNLRNMVNAGVPRDIVRRGFEQCKMTGVLPFQFVAAARHAPRYEQEVEKAMLGAMADAPKWDAHVLLVIDRSGSMSASLSERSELTRYDAACALAIILREVCADATIVTVNDTWGGGRTLEIIPARRGFALRDALGTPQGGTPLGWGISKAEAENEHDRIVVFTDEQSRDAVPNPRVPGYMVNIASAENGVGYGNWLHIDGFSESVVRYIMEMDVMLAGAAE